MVRVLYLDIDAFIDVTHWPLGDGQNQKENNIQVQISTGVSDMKMVLPRFSKSTLVQFMAWCRQATCYNLS